MYPFWDVIIKPTLERLKPKVIVEVGSEAANSTVHLARFCQEHGAVLHSIDPAPKFDVQEFSARFPGCFVFHKAKSLDALPQIEHYDAVLIDGDHNWYTVFNELRLLESRDRTTGPEFPLVFLHDVGWPYGRRDLYYDPAAIPEKFRHPYARRGMHPDHKELLPVGGLNAGLNNALKEGTARNGVLTAVEDFLAQSSIPFEFWTLPGLSGLGFLIPKRLFKKNPALHEYLQRWRLPEDVLRYLSLLEDFRIRGILRLLHVQQTLGRQNRVLSERVYELENVVRKLTADLHNAQTQLQQLQSGSTNPQQTQ